MQIVVHDQGAARVAMPLFCAACRSALLQLLFGVERFRPRRAQPASPELETVADQVARYGATWPRRSRRRTLQHFYEDAEQLLETS